MKTNRFPRENRIKRNREILNVLSQGRRARQGALTLFFYPAHVRNRHKRWAREAFRNNRGELKESGSILVRFQHTANSYNEVEEALLEAYRMAIENSRSPA